jgi:bifunctional non-homologous end joining protein LigD
MIPQALRDQPAMLADQSKNVAPLVGDALKILVDRGEHFFDIKWDGIRCLAYVEYGAVTLINRRKVDITYRYPDLVAALSEMFESNRMVVLDGEIICLKDGLPDFARAHKRDAQANAGAAAALAAAYPATYMAFDLLYHDGDDLRHMPYAARRAMLKTLAEGSGHDQVQWSRSEQDGEAMWNFVTTVGLEGLIAKHKTAAYRAGRGSAWIKLKPTRSLSALVSGYDQGKGHRTSTFGNLHLVLLDDQQQFQPIGKVGSGFTEADLKMLLPRLQNPDPANPLIVEVEYQEVSPAQQLRFPVYKGVRTDVGLLDCKTSQLTD